MWLNTILLGNADFTTSFWVKLLHLDGFNIHNNNGEGFTTGSYLLGKLDKNEQQIWKYLQLVIQSISFENI